MNSWRVKLSLFLTYFVFAILLNSVGTVILQSIDVFGVSKPAASVLEGFKDIPIAVVSFLVASFLPRYGYKRAMITGLLIVSVACAAMPLINTFLMTKLLFLAIGVSFALVKVSVYSTVGLVVESRSAHASLLNLVEGIFMIGVLAGYWLFGYFIGIADRPEDWVDVYWVLVALCVLNVGLLLTTKFDESGVRPEGSDLAGDFMVMLRLMAKPMVYVFVIAAFMYVLIEQGLGTWLPTFNKEILKLPSDMSVQAASIFAASLAIGRLSAGAIMQRVNWYPVLNVCVIAMALLVVLTLPLTQDIVARDDINWLNAPIAGYIFPLIGLFMAPIYPAINSVMLSALPKSQHSAMTGLIVIFSALGGTTGSLITGVVFGRFDGQTAFYLSLVPMAIIMLALFLFKRATDGVGVAADAH